MDLGKYNSLSSCDSVYVSKAIAIVESLLGYSLDPEVRNENQIPGTTGQNRLFTFHKDDVYTLIDPAYTITSVKLYRNFKYEEDLEFNVVLRNGLVRYLFLDFDYPCGCRVLCNCSTYQILVDADWSFKEGDIPEDLISVIADVSSYYGDSKSNIKKETLATHSYEKFDNGDVFTNPIPLEILKKYAGPKGTLTKRLI